ncbi:hypothetical protein KC19_3G140100, partial [Ceratodon purpureus]
QLPGVEAQELRGRQISKSARSYEDLASRKGIVVVELGEAQKGMVSQVATLKATSIEFNDEKFDHKKEMQEMRQWIQRKLEEMQEIRQKMGQMLHVTRIASKCLGGGESTIKWTTKCKM